MIPSTFCFQGSFGDGDGDDEDDYDKWTEGIHVPSGFASCSLHDVQSMLAFPISTWLCLASVYFYDARG